MLPVHIRLPEAHVEAPTALTKLRLVAELTRLAMPALMHRKGVGNRTQALHAAVWDADDVCVVKAMEECRRCGEGQPETARFGLPAFRRVMEKLKAVSVNCLHGRLAASLLLQGSHDADADQA